MAHEIGLITKHNELLDFVAKHSAQTQVITANQIKSNCYNLFAVDLNDTGQLEARFDAQHLDPKSVNKREDSGVC